MQAILDWFESVSATISSLIDFVVGIISDLANLVALVADASATIPKLFGLLPAPVVAAFTAAIGIVVLYKILGREG